MSAAVQRFPSGSIRRGRLAPVAAPKVHSFIDRLALMKVEAAEMGLFKTMHALDHATRAVGFEVAELMEKEGTT